MKKSALMVIFAFTLMAFGLVSSLAWASASLSEQYYQKFPLKAEKLDPIWGKPVLVETLDNGLERRVYEIEAPYPASLRYRYFLIQRGMVLASGVTDIIGTPGKGRHLRSHRPAGQTLEQGLLLAAQTGRERSRPGLGQTDHCPDPR